MFGATKLVGNLQINAVGDLEGSGSVFLSPNIFAFDGVEMGCWDESAFHYYTEML